MPPEPEAPGNGAFCPPPSTFVGAVGRGLFVVVDVVFAFVVEFPDEVLFPVEFPNDVGEAEFVIVTMMACVLVVGTLPGPRVTT